MFLGSITNPRSTGKLFVQWSTSSLRHFVHPVTVATFGDQLCHLEPKYWGIFQKKGPMSLHLRHMYIVLINFTNNVAVCCRVLGMLILYEYD